MTRKWLSDLPHRPQDGADAPEITVLPTVAVDLQLVPLGRAPQTSTNARAGTFYLLHPAIECLDL